MIAEKIKPPANRADWPRCQHKVRLSATMTTTRRIREVRSRDRGLPPEICGSYATHLIDDVPHCASHAGQVALEFVIMWHPF